jgi:hypothetical protein
MSRKVQIAALIFGMFLVGVERFTASASAATSKVEPTVSDAGVPVPPLD